VAVHVVTLPLVAPVIETGFRPGEVGLDDGAATFVTAWDYLSVVDRKNPLATVEAYTNAFAPGGGTQLLLKGTNADRRPDDHQRIQYAARSRPDIHLWTGQLEPSRYAALLASATGVVSLHRSEGLALNLADAIALGVPTIATGYGGNLTFMSPADTALVPYELVDVGPGQHPYPPDAQWAEPDCAIAARHMREIVADPGRARERAQQAQRRISVDFSLQRSAASVSRLLGAIAHHDSPGAARRSLRRRFPRSST
jgi:glycosyltransferase involved in cell wall biosynthesis